MGLVIMKHLMGYPCVTSMVSLTTSLHLLKLEKILNNLLTGCYWRYVAMYIKYIILILYNTTPKVLVCWLRLYPLRYDNKAVSINIVLDII